MQGSATLRLLADRERPFAERLEAAERLASSLLDEAPPPGVPVPVIAHYLKSTAEWLLSSLVKSQPPSAGVAPREDVACWRLLAKLLNKGGSLLSGLNISPALCTAAAAACESALKEGHVTGQQLVLELPSALLETLQALEDGFELAFRPTLEQRAVLLEAALNVWLARQVQATAAEAWHRLVLHLLTAFRSYAVAHPNPRKVYMVVLNKLLQPLCRVAFPTLDAPVFTKADYNPATATAAAQQLLALVLLHSAHMQGLCEVSQSRAAAELQRVQGSRSSEAAPTVAAGAVVSEEQEAQGPPKKRAKTATPGQEQSALAYQGQLSQVLGRAVSAALQRGDQADAAPLLQALVFLQAAFSEALRRHQRVLAEDAASTAQAMLSRKHKDTVTADVTAAIKSADMHFAIVLASMLLPHVKSADNASVAMAPATTAAADRSPAFAGKQPKKRQQKITQRQQQQQEQQPGSIAAWVTAVRGLAALLHSMQQTLTYRPTQDTTQSHRAFLDSITQAVMCSYGDIVTRTSHEGAASTYAVSAVASFVCSMLDLEHRVLHSHLPQLYSLMFDAAAMAESAPARSTPAGSAPASSSGAGGRGMEAAVAIAVRLVSAYTELRQVEVLLATLTEAVASHLQQQQQQQQQPKHTPPVRQAGVSAAARLLAQPAFTAAVRCAMSGVPPGQTAVLVGFVNSSLVQCLVVDHQAALECFGELYAACLDGLRVGLTTAVQVATAAEALLVGVLGQRLAAALAGTDRMAERPGELTLLLRVYASVIRLHAHCAAIHPGVAPLPGQSLVLPITASHTHLNGGPATNAAARRPAFATDQADMAAEHGAAAKDGGYFAAVQAPTSTGIAAIDLASVLRTCLGQTARHEASAAGRTLPASTHLALLWCCMQRVQVLHEQLLRLAATCPIITLADARRQERSAAKAAGRGREAGRVAGGAVGKEGSAGLSMAAAKDGSDHGSEEEEVEEEEEQQQQQQQKEEETEELGDDDDQLYGQEPGGQQAAEVPAELQRQEQQRQQLMTAVQAELGSLVQLLLQPFQHSASKQQLSMPATLQAWDGVVAALPHGQLLPAIWALLAPTLHVWAPYAKPEQLVMVLRTAAAWACASGSSEGSQSSSESSSRHVQHADSVVSGHESEQHLQQQAVQLFHTEATPEVASAANAWLAAVSAELRLAEQPDRQETASATGHSALADIWRSLEQQLLVSRPAGSANDMGQMVSKLLQYASQQHDAAASGQLVSRFAPYGQQQQQQQQQQYQFQYAQQLLSLWLHMPLHVCSEVHRQQASVITLAAAIQLTELLLHERVPGQMQIVSSCLATALQLLARLDALPGLVSAISSSKGASMRQSAQLSLTQTLAMCSETCMSVAAAAAAAAAHSNVPGGAAHDATDATPSTSTSNAVEAALAEGVRASSALGRLLDSIFTSDAGLNAITTATTTDSATTATSWATEAAHRHATAAARAIGAAVGTPAPLSGGQVAQEQPQPQAPSQHGAAQVSAQGLMDAVMAAALCGSLAGAPHGAIAQRAVMTDSSAACEALLAVLSQQLGLHSRQQVADATAAGEVPGPGSARKRSKKGAKAAPVAAQLVDARAAQPVLVECWSLLVGAAGPAQHMHTQTASGDEAGRQTEGKADAPCASAGAAVVQQNMLQPWLFEAMELLASAAEQQEQQQQPRLPTVAWWTGPGAAAAVRLLAFIEAAAVRLASDGSCSGLAYEQLLHCHVALLQYLVQPTPMAVLPPHHHNMQDVIWTLQHALLQSQWDHYSDTGAVSTQQQRHQLEQQQVSSAHRDSSGAVAIRQAVLLSLRSLVLASSREQLQELHSMLEVGLKASSKPQGLCHVLQALLVVLEAPAGGHALRALSRHGSTHAWALISIINQLGCSNMAAQALDLQQQQQQPQGQPSATSPSSDTTSSRVSILSALAWSLRCLESIIGREATFTLHATVPASVLQAVCSMLEQQPIQSAQQQHQPPATSSIGAESAAAAAATLGALPGAAAVFNAACGLLVALVRHRHAQLRRQMALMVDAARALLVLLLAWDGQCQMAALQGGSGAGGSSYQAHLLRCGEQLARLYEAIAEHQQSLGKYCHHMIADYIIHAAAGQEPSSSLAAAQQELLAREAETSTGSSSGHQLMEAGAACSAAVAAAVRQGALAVFGVLSPAEIQHVHAVLGGGPLASVRRSALAELKGEYEKQHREGGKV